MQQFVLQFTIIYFPFICKQHLGGGFIIHDVKRMSTSKNQKVSETFGTTCCHLTKKKIKTQSWFSVKFIKEFFQILWPFNNNVTSTRVSVPLQNHQTDPDLGPELYKYVLSTLERNVVAERRRFLEIFDSELVPSRKSGHYFQETFLKFSIILLVSMSTTK